MRLVDHDHVPAAVFEMDAVVGAGLQGVDGDDGAVVIVERVGVGGNAGADAVDADGIEAHQRDGEARPHFLLELGHHALHRDDQNALAAATLNEFAQQDADFDCLAKTGRIRHENTLPRLVEGLKSWVELERQVIYCCPVADPQVRIRWWRLAQEAFQVKLGLSELRRVIGDQRGLGRIEDLDPFALDLCEEPRFLVPDDFGDAGDQQ